MAALLLAGLARAEQQLPVYPGVVHTRIGNDLVIGGEFYRLAYFTTTDPMEQVARYFEKQWKEQGYPTVVDGDLHEEAVVSALYTREGLQRGVVLRRHDGKTLGFTVLRDLWERPPASATPGLVKLEGAMYSADVGSRDADGDSQHRTSLIEQSLASVQKELEAKLASAGFRRTRETRQQVDGRPQLTLEFASGAQQVVASLTEMEPQLTAVVQMSVGSDRLDGVSNDAAVRAGKAKREEKGAQR
ncbi:hypothetical protein FGE12_24300 [Aggregicoccus sp. 17bor-14]|uniref:hypothetical protein n=1 Tax=Myxococcaceae TaxID=31 RepID=UPI00129C5461|nr:MULTISPECIES: hypothetical protein [Myxococcaceae]MBF5045552.1 hypothetical protein [Simulacricoccus sp. 17bor-14]MRI91289.1 hypothetical protein [Aggregicoccus sp. 17bor-14]